jgi:hypothetical protein
VEALSFGAQTEALLGFLSRLLPSTAGLGAASPARQ